MKVHEIRHELLDAINDLYRNDAITWTDYEQLWELITQLPDKSPRTYAEDFKAKFPGAFTTPRGYPAMNDGIIRIMCRKHFYGNNPKCHSTGCMDCWDEPMPEVDE